LFAGLGLLAREISRFVLAVGDPFGANLEGSVEPEPEVGVLARHPPREPGFEHHVIALCGDLALTAVERTVDLVVVLGESVEL